MYCELYAGGVRGRYAAEHPTLALLLPPSPSGAEFAPPEIIEITEITGAGVEPKGVSREEETGEEEESEDSGGGRRGRASTPSRKPGAREKAVPPHTPSIQRDQLRAAAVKQAIQHAWRGRLWRVWGEACVGRGVCVARRVCGEARVWRGVCVARPHLLHFESY